MASLALLSVLRVPSLRLKYNSKACLLLTLLWHNYYCEIDIKSSTMAKYSKAAQDKIEKVMHEKKRGTLKSGRSGKKVTSRKQAIAIGISEARQAGAKVPSKKKAAKKKTAKKKSAPRKAAKKKSTAKKGTRKRRS